MPERRKNKRACGGAAGGGVGARGGCVLLGLFWSLVGDVVVGTSWFLASSLLGLGHARLSLRFVSLLKDE